MFTWTGTFNFRLAAAVTLAAVLAFAFAATGPQAQEADDTAFDTLMPQATRLSDGETVHFFVPGETEVFTGSAGDVVVFTGPSQRTVDPGSCGNPTIDNHLYDTVFVDPGAGRASPCIDVVVTTHPDGLPPGTRLGDLALIGPCGANGAFQQKYRAIVR